MKKFIFVGCGKYGRNAVDIVSNEREAAYIDNNLELEGKVVKGVQVYSFERLKSINWQEYYLVITAASSVAGELAEQLIACGSTQFMLYEEFLQFVENDFKGYGELCRKSLQRLIRQYQDKIERAESRVTFVKEHFDAGNIRSAVGYPRKKQCETAAFGKAVVDMLAQNGIHTFMICDSLLGKVRHNGFIPWDDDIDFGCMRADYEKLIAYFEQRDSLYVYEGLACDTTEQAMFLKHLTENNNDYFLIQYPEHTQVNLCVGGLMNRKAVDFFCFDSYGDYDFAKHKKLIRDTERIFSNQKTAAEKYKTIQNANQIEGKYRDINGENIYFSLDSCLSYMRDNDEWIPRECIFPLQKIDFEGYEFYAPAQIERYLNYEFKDYMKLPDDFALETHGYAVAQKQKLLCTAEFYLVDAFEIYHFEPLYHMFRAHNVYARFVAENNGINTSGKWFDYDTAKRILNERELEYAEYCNVDADMAFTTQFSYNLRKYRHAVKINMTYGCSFNRDGFWFRESAMKGFAYKLVNGQFTKDRCLEKKILDETQIKVIGSPKHYRYQYRQIDKTEIYKELNIKTDKPVLLYLPTWDEDSSISLFEAELKKLRHHFYIVTKPHHCTYRLPEKKADLDSLKNISDIVLDGNYDFEKACMIGDVRICDAKSGSGLESIVLNPNIPVVFLSVRKDIDVEFYPDIYEAADAVVNDKDKLVETVETVFEKGRMRRKDFDYYWADFDEQKLWKIMQDIMPREKRNRVVSIY